MPREGPPPPFRTHPFGPGHEVDLPGVRLVWLDESGTPRAAIRTGSGGVRVSDSEGVRVGRLHRSADGWSVRSRDGVERCTGRAGRTRWVLECDESGRWSVQSDRGGFTIRHAGAVLGTVSPSPEGGTAAVWQAAEGDASSGAPLPPVAVTAVLPPCGVQVEVRDSTGRLGGSVRPVRWGPEAVAALSGVANTLQARSELAPAGFEGEAWLVPAALAWWIDQQAGRPSRSTCEGATDPRSD